MKLRTRKRLLDLFSLSLVAGGAATLAAVWRQAPPVVSVDAPRVVKRLQKSDSAPPPVIDVASASWQRVLRRPLYDPPPPPVQEVVAPPRPITVALVGTVLESENSQAFLRQQNGVVEIKRLGDLLTADPADGVIDQITAAAIVIRREDGEHHLSVENSN